MQTTGRWKYRSNSADCFSEVSVDHTVCSLMRSVMLCVTDGASYRLFPVTSNTLQRTLQMNLSSSLNTPLTWISLFQGWEFLSWKSTLLCLGSLSISVSLEFFPPLGSTLSSKQLHRTAVQWHTPQEKGLPHAGASSCPVKWPVQPSAFAQLCLSLICITFHPHTQGHFLEIPLWGQTVFLHHREVLTTLEESPYYLI